jgi:malate dehydrogenase
MSFLSMPTGFGSYGGIGVGVGGASPFTARYSTGTSYSSAPGYSSTYASPMTPSIGARSVAYPGLSTYAPAYGARPAMMASSFAPLTATSAMIPALPVTRYAAASPAKGKFKVCVCGGAGGIGQPLSLLMAMDENVAELSVQDVTMALVPAAGVAADLGHLEKNCTVTPYAIDPKVPAVEQLEACLTGCSLVLVPAGVPRKPGMTRDDLFGINAGIAKGIVEACAAYCPDAILALIVNPVNSIVPAMAEIYRSKGLDPRKIVGVTTLDCVRANKFVAEKLGVDAAKVSIPVVARRPPREGRPRGPRGPADHGVRLRRLRGRVGAPLLHHQGDLRPHWGREGSSHWPYD